MDWSLFLVGILIGVYIGDCVRLWLEHKKERHSIDYHKGYKEAINKACEWIKNNLEEDGVSEGEIEYCFRKAMEE